MRPIIEKDFPYLGDAFKGRRMPNGKIRGKVAQRELSDLPLFAKPPKEEQREMFVSPPPPAKARKEEEPWHYA